MLIASSPVAAYLFTFAYEAGFANSFGIPFKLISLNLTAVVMVTFVVIAIVTLALMFPNIIVASETWTKHPSYKIFVKPQLLLKAVYPVLLLGIVFALTSFFVELSIVSVVFAVFVSILYPMIYMRLLTPIHGALFGLLFLLITCFFAGRDRASTNPDFLIASTLPETVVLAIYGENMICAPFDRTTKQVARDFSVLRIGDDPELSLRLERVGPLHSTD